MSNKQVKDSSKLKISQMEFLIMMALTEKELYGLQIEKAVNEGSGGQFNVKISSLYPILGNLEDNGLVESRWGEKRLEERGRARRRFYKLTSLEPSFSKIPARSQWYC